MHLIYLDETGNTGCNLTDPAQPVFVLAALIVDEEQWQSLEHDLRQALDKHVPDRPPDFELRAAELSNPHEPYTRGLRIETRLALRDRLFQIAITHKLKLIYRAIEKQRFHAWQQKELGAGVTVNPHIAAFPFVACAVDDYLAGLKGSHRGMFICDENKDVYEDVEKAIQALRFMEGALRLKHVIEKGFFIDSRKSLPLQLCDLCAYAIRRKEEQKLGIALRPLYATWTTLADPLIHVVTGANANVFEWITAQQKKGRPGT